jgi:EPS-associated MarR family transcriptional regulator
VDHLELSTKDFHVLDALDSHKITTQRQLSEKSGISLGHVNYLLKSLLEKGLVKMGRFSKSPNKMGYAYHLTPKGLEAKSRLAARFVVSKLKEYSHLERKIKEKLTIIESKRYVNIVLVGPEIVKDFVDKIIKEHSLNLHVVDSCNALDQLEAYDIDSYDMALVMDGKNTDMEAMSEDIKVLQDKVLPLW